MSLGTDVLLAEPVPAAEGWLRAAGRRPSGIPRPRLRPDLLESGAAVLLSVLRCEDEEPRLIPPIMAFADHLIGK